MIRCAIKIIAIALTMFVIGLIIGKAALAEEALLATAYLLEIKEANTCDRVNSARRIRNRHEFRTIEVEVRWRANGGGTVTERFFIEPGATRVLGCAVGAIEILDAKFTDF